MEVLADPSKQMKIVVESMNNPDFNETIDSAPTNVVSISSLDESDSIKEYNSNK